MKWAAVVLVSAVLIAPAASQLRSIPPSVTSIGGSHSPGIPPSVTSIGNSFFNAPTFCCRTSLFPNQFEFGRRSGFHFHQGRVRGFAFPGVIAVPVAVPVPIVPVLYESADALQDAADPQQPETTPRVRRPARVDEEDDAQDGDRYGEHYLDSRERRRPAPHDSAADEPNSREDRKPARKSAEETKDNKSAESRKPEPVEIKPAAPQPATVLIFRDGHKG